MTGATAGALLLVTVGATVLPALGRRLRVPVAIVEILYGVVIGGSGLGIVRAHEQPFLTVLADLGFALFLLVAGLELDFDEIDRAGRRALAGGLLVSALSIGAALGMSRALGWSPWLGLAAGATSVPLLMAVLRELGRLGSPTGRRLVTLAALGEVVTVAVIALFELLGGHEAASLGAALRLVLPVAGVVLAGVLLRAAAWWYPSTFSRLVASEDPQELGVRVGLGLMFVFVGLAILGGIEPVLGAFLAGLTLAYVLRDKGALEHKLGSMAYGFFVPVFFVSVGVRLELSPTQLLDDLPFVLSLLGVMLAAKAISGLFLVGSGVRARHALAGTLLLASPLTLVIAIADLAARAEAITGGQETAVVAAGMLASLLFPTLARLLLTERRASD